VNEDLAEIDASGRLLFIGLWCLADREGKLEDRPKRIKGEIFRFDGISSQEVDALLNQLREFQLIIRYEVDGVRFIQIPNFLKRFLRTMVHSRFFGTGERPGKERPQFRLLRSYLFFWVDGSRVSNKRFNPGGLLNSRTN